MKLRSRQTLSARGYTKDLKKFIRDENNFFSAFGYKNIKRVILTSYSYIICDYSIEQNEQSQVQLWFNKECREHPEGIKFRDPTGPYDYTRDGLPEAMAYYDYPPSNINKFQANTIVFAANGNYGFRFRNKTQVMDIQLIMILD